MKIEAGRVNQVSAGRYGFSLKINGSLIPQGITPLKTFREAKSAMNMRLGALQRAQIKAQDVAQVTA